MKTGGKTSKTLGRIPWTISKLENAIDGSIWLKQDILKAKRQK